MREDFNVDALNCTRNPLLNPARTSWKADFLVLL